MNYPKRAESHVTETKSWKIFTLRSPDEWILRDLTERDYGIDAYAELVGSDRMVKGDMVSIQLKGSSSLKWPTADLPQEFTFSGIEISTINYWMGLQMPVFLVVTDESTSEAFFASIEPQVRSRYELFRSQKTFGFKLNRSHELGTAAGREEFIRQYAAERKFESYKYSVLAVISNWASYLSFLDKAIRNDSWMEMQSEDEVTFVHLHDTVFTVAEFLNLQVQFPTLDAIYRRNAKSPDENHDLRYWAVQESAPRLRGALVDVVGRLKILICEEQPDYWEVEHNAVHRSCYVIGIEQYRDQEFFE